MNYQAIVDMLLDSPVDRWERVSGNQEYAFCKDDVNLRIVCTLDDEDIQQENFREKWANDFPDGRARGYYYNLYYCQTLLHKFILVSVDGARASLPVPEIGTTEVTRAQWKVAEIFDGLGSLYDYARKAGLSEGSKDGL